MKKVESGRNGEQRQMGSGFLYLIIMEEIGENDIILSELILFCCCFWRDGMVLCNVRMVYYTIL